MSGAQVAIKNQSLWAALDVSEGARRHFWGMLRVKKTKVSSLYLSREEKHEQIDSAPLLLKSDKWSQRRWGCEVLISPECVLANAGATERDMLLCDKGVRADKRVCVKCFKYDLNSDVKEGREGESSGWGQKERWAYRNWCRNLLCQELLWGCPHFLIHKGKCYRKTCGE